MESIIRSLQYYNGTTELWDSYYKIIPKGTMVISKDEANDDYILKLGNGIHTYKNLSEFLRMSSFVNLHNLKKFSFLSGSDVNRLLYYNGDIIESTSFTITELITLFNILSTQLTIKTCVTKPIITAKESVRYNTTFTLYAKSISAYGHSGIKIDQYVWELPDLTYTDGDSIEYIIPNEPGLVGTTLDFRCRAIDQLENMSDWSEFEILVVNTSSNPVVISAILD